MRRGTGGVSILVIGVGLLLFAGVASGQEEPTTFTACLDREKGELSNVSTGPDPVETCKKDETIVSWNSLGPPGPVGPAGPQGEPGQDGADGEPCTVADDGQGTITMTCPDGSTASWEGTTTSTTTQPDTDGDVTLVRLLNGDDEWIRIQDTSGDGQLGPGDDLVISALPVEGCGTTALSNGTYETIGFFYEDDYGSLEDGRNYMFSFEGRNIFGETESRVIALQVDYVSSSYLPRQSGFAMGLDGYANIQFASQDSQEAGYFGHVFERVMPSFGFNSLGSFSCPDNPKFSVTETLS